jgi:hypothetical protein
VNLAQSSFASNSPVEWHIHYTCSVRQTVGKQQERWVTDHFVIVIPLWALSGLLSLVRVVTADPWWLW